MVKTTDLVADLRVCRHGGCSACGHDCGTAECIDHVIEDAADKIEELVERCARYAEEIAVLREKSKWVNPAERLPEYGVPVLAVVSGKTRNITLFDAVVIATFYDGWELEDYPPADELTVKWWLPMAKSPEGGDGECEV